MNREEKRAAYETLLGEIEAVLGEVDDPITLQAISSAIIKGHLPYASWIGFYRVTEPGLLRVGPYQGPLPCLEVAFGQGVCGTAAAELRTQLVADVHAFPGHIACDANARSEIVVPVYDSSGALAAVLDADSHQLSAFDEIDREGLEKVAAFLATRMS